ncbi:uncharacterized protein LOC126557270 [Anopheles maculipalpis]|uniref:uncharacterized protein LOC126557270 n=1 Tax=Anopheles maculipalpis TaxID=1496333 RepID=UPI00215941B1|nr:uncharacterized protein LOC126557270 [Anopheles maculipalpis]
MEDYFKVIIRDENWDVRSAAKRYGELFQLYVDRKKPTEVYIKYKSIMDANNARANLAKNENVVRVEALEKWNIPAKKMPDSKVPEIKSSGTGMAERNAQNRGVGNKCDSGIRGIGDGLIEPIPLLLGMFNACTACRKSNASYQCFVCGAFYCGEQCQRTDWPGHIVQCLPRLVRIHTGFMPNETQSMACPPPPITPMHVNTNHAPAKNNLKQNLSNQQDGLNRAFGTNVAPKSPIKATKREQNQDEASVKIAPLQGSVPTNVLKNLALKRHQEQKASTSKPTTTTGAATTAAGKVEQQDQMLATNAKENASKLAKLVQQKSAPKRTIQYSAFPLEGEYVKISYVADTTLFVYRSGQEANGQTNRYIDLIKRSVECARGVKELLTAAPKLSEIVFAPFDGDHYRAVVKSVDGPMATVFYPDFGNTQTVEWNQMKEIPDKEIQYCMCYTHPVMVEGVSEFSPLVKQYLEELLEMDDFELIRVNKQKSATTVEMRHAQELYLLSEKLKGLAKEENDKEESRAAAQAAAKVVAEEKADTAEQLPPLDSLSLYVKVTAEDFIEHALPLGEDVKLMVVEASELNVSNQLSVILTSDSLAFAKMMNECDQYGNKDPNAYQPSSENEVFLLHFDGVWCRALLAGLGEQVQYYLLDLGIIRALDEKPKCRRFPTGLTRKMFVCECIVDNLEALGEFAKEENNDMLRGKILTAKVYQHTDEEGEPMHVKIHSIH